MSDNPLTVMTLFVNPMQVRVLYNNISEKAVMVESGLVKVVLELMWL
jgi:hypothetical protein